MEEEREICRLYLKFAGFDEGDAEGLLSLPYETLFQAGRALDQYVWEHYMGRCSFCPVVDGVFLKDFPTLADFTGLDKPVLVGSNRSEGNFQAAYTWPDGRCCCSVFPRSGRRRCTPATQGCRNGRFLVRCSPT